MWRIPRVYQDAWRFGPHDHYLEAPPSAAHDELIRVADGQVLAFSAGVLPIAPDDDHVIVWDGGPVLWSVSGMQRLLGPPRARAVLARSRDGAVTVVMNGRHLTLERASTCSDLGVEVSPFDSGDSIVFTPDGRYRYVGRDGGATISTSTAFTWDLT